jgi:two-component system, cell cycle response regulator DivK
MLRRLLKSAKSNRCNFEPINLEIQRAGKGGCNINLIAAFGKVADPIDCNRGAAIHDEEVAHKDGLYVIARGAETRYIYQLMTKGRILVVEDNMDNYELVRFILERAGYDVFLAVNGRDGVDAARLQKPDMILMDLGMPEMDGWEAAEKLKSNETTKFIPLYALSAYTRPSERKRALDAGCDGYLSKPIQMDKFLSAINEVFETKINKHSL